MRRISLVCSVGAVAFCWATALHGAEGYDDTPYLPDGKWRVHDKARPLPPVVQPAPAGEPVPPPADAFVLFDGKDLSQWNGKWKVESGYMEINATGDMTTKEGFGSCQLHVEFATPKKAEGKSQGRGNSGIYFMNRYEIQVLDSHGNETYADGQCASVYGQHPPLVNASRAPGEWQTYDIIFDAPVFKDGKVVKPAYVTIIHNGVLVQNHTEILGTGVHRQLAQYQAHGNKEPIRLQDHGNPVRYRNIWIRPMKTGN